MTSTPEGEGWVDGTYEAGADDDREQRQEVPGSESGGAGVGATGDANTFEPEEPAAPADDSRDA